MTNNELQFKLKKCQQGDIKAFEEIYEGMKNPLMTVIMRIIGDRQISEDILQEVFIKLYFSPYTKEVLKPRAYIFKMASNMAIDTLRKQKPVVSLEECGEIPGNNCLDNGVRPDVEKALGKLIPDNRRIVTLHINAGLTFREISNITGMPLGTVIWKYQRAIKELRKYLAD